MATNYLPTREGALLTWAWNFSTKINASPAAAPLYGLTVDQATAYHTLFLAYQASYNTANDPNTRSPVSIAAKNTAKKALIDNTRELVDICQAWPDMTNAKRADLGITIRAESAPVPPPTVAPLIDIKSVVGLKVQLRLHDGSGTSRAKPEGVAGASVFSFVGDVAPVEIGLWKFESSTTTTMTTVDFAPTVTPGTKVWLTAFWYNPRAESGPATPPVSTHVGAGLSKAA